MKSLCWICQCSRVFKTLDSDVTISLAGNFMLEQMVGTTMKLISDFMSTTFIEILNRQKGEFKKLENEFASLLKDPSDKESGKGEEPGSGDEPF